MMPGTLREGQPETYPESHTTRRTGWRPCQTRNAGDSDQRGKYCLGSGQISWERGDRILVPRGEKRRRMTLPEGTA